MKNIFQFIFLTASFFGVLIPSVSGNNQTKAMYVAGFEEDEQLPQYYLFGHQGSTMEVIDNPYKEPLNSSNKVLKLDQTNETVWWSRVTIELSEPLQITAQNKYVHYMIYSPTNVSLIAYVPAVKWFNSTISRNTWNEFVVDLSAYVGLVIDKIEICPNMLNSQKPICYIDNIEFNGNATPRQPPASFLDDISCTLNILDEDWTFTDKKPEVEIIVKNNSGTAQILNIICDVYTDTKEPFNKSEEEVSLAVGASSTKKFTLPNAVPGFYFYYVKLSEGTNLRTKTYKLVGYKPVEIISETNRKSDFETFWQDALTELANSEPNYKVTTRSTTSERIVYDVEMNSLKGYLIKGYLSVPNKPGKFPAIVLSNGYNAEATIPSRKDDFIEFNYNVRGQKLSNTGTPYPVGWIVSGLEDKDTYYYREAYMDAIRAVDFVYSRPEVDRDLLFAEGSSQGGSLTYAIAALDKRIKGAVPLAASLSDFEDFYTIKQNAIEYPIWPMDLFDKFMKDYNVSHDELFNTLSYFDIKNLAPYITVPLLMGVGLQDTSCPPHIQFAAYNQVKGERDYLICKEHGHNLWTNAEFKAYKEKWYENMIKRITTGIGNGSKNKPQIAISSASSKIVVNQTASEPMNINVYNLNGIAYPSVYTSDNHYEINCPEGLYVIQVVSQSANISQKINVLR